MADDPVRRTVELEVLSAAETESKREPYEPQWELSVKVNAISNYPFKAWIPRQAGQQPPPKRTYTSIIERGRLKQDKDGHYDNHYQWNIYRFNTGEAVTGNGHEEAPAASQPGIPAPRIPEDVMKADHPSKRRSIERQGAVDKAIAYYSIGGGAKDVRLNEDLLATAEAIYRWISQEPTPAEELGL
jgi:hypothetical protein